MLLHIGPYAGHKNLKFQKSKMAGGRHVEKEKIAAYK